MQGRSILPERRRTCSRWEEDWFANGPPAPTGITPFTTIRKFPIPSVRSSSRARSSSSTEVRSGRQTSVNSVLPGSRSAAMARSYFALAPCREATGPMHVWPLPCAASSIWRDQSTGSSSRRSV